MARLLCLVVTLFLSLGFAAAQSQNSVIIRSTGLLPEGLDYSAASLSFYTTSLSQGGIYTVSDAGVVTPFGDAGKKTISTAGIQVDDKRGLLYVCNTDAVFPNPTNKGSVVAVKQSDGSIAFIARFDNLGKNNTAAKLINDVVQDSRGNLYATDSYNGAIYKYDLETKKASLFVQDPILAPQDSTGLGVNGIDYYNNGGLEFLLVTRSGQNVANSGLFRIPLKTPTRITRVTINVPVSYNPPSGLDGAFLDPTNNERIYVVGNSIVYSLETRDDWSSATVTKNLGAKETSTSLTFVGGSYNKVYVMSLNGFGPGPYSIDRYSLPYTAGPVNNDGDSSSASMLAFSPLLFVVLLLVNFLF